VRGLRSKWPRCWVRLRARYGASRKESLVRSQSSRPARTAKATADQPFAHWGLAREMNSNRCSLLGYPSRVLRIIRPTAAQEGLVSWRDKRGLRPAPSLPSWPSPGWLSRYPTTPPNWAVRQPKALQSWLLLARRGGSVWGPGRTQRGRFPTARVGSGTPATSVATRAIRASRRNDGMILPLSATISG
jgi:hypothetical protein